MKDERDPGTIDMPLLAKRRRGRPSTGKAKSAAERMREYRARTVAVNRNVLEAALQDASQLDQVAFQVDGMDRLDDENRELRAEVGRLQYLLRVERERVDALMVECTQLHKLAYS